MLRKLVKRILYSGTFVRLCRRPRIRELFFFVSPNFTPLVVADTDDLRYLVRTHDLSVSRELFVRRGFDAEVLPQVLRLLDHFGCGAVQGKTFVDIGANIGTSVISAVRLHGFSRGIAIEPEPTNHLLIQINALMNGVADRVSAHKFAISNRKTELIFEIAPENSGDNRVRTEIAANGVELHEESQRATISVEGIEFDDLLERGLVNLADVGLIWMDTQGHEGHVLSGAKKLLASDIPILLEYWPYALNRSGGLDLLDGLIRQHYTHFIDVREQIAGEPPKISSVEQLGSLREKYRGVVLTDILLIKTAVKMREAADAVTR